MRRFGAHSISVLLLLLGCDGEITLDSAVRIGGGSAPTANAGADQTVHEFDHVVLDGSASNDPNDFALTYHWRQVDGPLVAMTGSRTAMARFDAPGVRSSLSLTFELEVDNGAHSDSSHVTVTVVNTAASIDDNAVSDEPIDDIVGSQDDEPSADPDADEGDTETGGEDEGETEQVRADAGHDQEVVVGDPLLLDGSASVGLDDQAILHSWVQLEGPTVLLHCSTCPVAEVELPNIVERTEFLFQLEVVSGDLSDTDTVSIWGNPQDAYVIADAGNDIVVDARTLVVLDGSNSRGTGQIEFSWLQTAGPSVELDGSNLAHASFVAPGELVEDTTLSFSLTVSNDDLDAQDSVNVVVRREAVTFTTLLGVHGGGNPACAAALRYQAGRIIVSDYNVIEGYDNGFELWSERLRTLKENGLQNIVTMRWPEDPQDSTKQDRIPTGEDRQAALDLIEQFLIDSDDFVDYFQANNEPLGGPGKYPEEQREEGLAWLADVLAHARRVITDHELDTRLITPAITGVGGAINGYQPTIDGITAIIEMARVDADAIDQHLHVTGLESLQEFVGWVQEHKQSLGVLAPLTSLEWSQAKSAFEWLDEEGRYEFIEAAYEERLTAEAWYDFVIESPLDENFMSEAFGYLNDQRFVHACYGGVWQYGDPRFDLKALVASLTVIEDDLPCSPPNEPFWSQYQALIDRIVQAQ